MAAVGMEHVTRRHGDVAVVRALTIQVRDREFMVLLGPSGSGKTTTLRLVAGLEPVSEGRIMIGERVVNDVPPRGRDVAMVFQSAGGLMPHLDVYRNLAFPLRVRRAERQEIGRVVGAAGRRLGPHPRVRATGPQLSLRPPQAGVAGPGV